MASDEQIRELAYFIWREEGCPDGKDLEHYFRAKQILEAREREQLKSKELISQSPSPAVTPSTSASKRPFFGNRQPFSKKSKK